MNPLSKLSPSKTLAEANARIDELVTLVKDLQARVEELSEQLGKSSRNSSKPPSSDSSSQRRKRRKHKPTGRAKGAQPRHQKHSREVVPQSAVDKIHRYFPNAQCSCGGHTAVDNEPNLRHQVVDLPMPVFTVDEHQVYSGRCNLCQRLHHADLPGSIPSGQLGPGLISWIVLMSGQFHLSIRKIQQLLLEQWQLSFSTGAICEAQGKANSWLSEHYKDIANNVRSSTVAHADETTHWSKGERAWLWVLASFNSVLFMTHPSRGKKAVAQLLGNFSGFSGE